MSSPRDRKQAEQRWRWSAPVFRRQMRWMRTNDSSETRCMADATLFAREDYIEEAWRIVDPILNNASPVYAYEPGTWGPREVDSLLLPPGGWHNPMPSAARAQQHDTNRTTNRNAVRSRTIG